MRERELIKIDRNGTKHFRVWTCPKCGGKGKDSAWSKSGWYCFKCGGTGIFEHIEKEYTPEYLAKQAEKNRRKAEQEIADRKAAYEADPVKSYREVRFGDSGILYVVTEPNTYSIKEDLKADGAKWRPQMSRWTFTERPKKWQTVGIRFEDLYHVNEYGVVALIDKPEYQAVDEMIGKGKGE